MREGVTYHLLKKKLNINKKTKKYCNQKYENTHLSVDESVMLVM